MDQLWEEGGTKDVMLKTPVLVPCLGLDIIVGSLNK